MVVTVNACLHPCIHSCVHGSMSGSWVSRLSGGEEDGRGKVLCTMRINREWEWGWKRRAGRGMQGVSCFNRELDRLF